MLPATHNSQLREARARSEALRIAWSPSKQLSNWDAFISGGNREDASNHSRFFRLSLVRLFPNCSICSEHRPWELRSSFELRGCSGAKRQPIGAIALVQREPQCEFYRRWKSKWHGI